MLNEDKKLIILGKNIARARKNKKLSQNRLADLLNISREHLAKIETAKRGISLTLIFRICEVLEINEIDLFTFE